jgi:hypothetical protein
MMNRISDLERARVAYLPQHARRYVAAGVGCDHCEAPAIANVHDDTGVRFLCRAGYLDLLAERREERRTEVRARFGLAAV